jgi:hypothetical protein
MAGSPIKSERNRLVREAILRALEKGGQPAEEALVPMAQKMIAQAQDGDVASFREIADRLDGKPSQQIDMAVSRAPAPELTEDELKRIAAGSSARAALPEPSEEIVSKVH